MTKPAGLMRRARGIPPNSVQFAPEPSLIDEQGHAIAGAQILEIRFPGEVAETAAGRLPVVRGGGVAKILVGAIAIRGVPLC